MRRIKLVLWERNIAHQQAEYLVQRETYRQELVSENKNQSPQKIEAQVLEKFPTAIMDIGRKEAKKTGSTRYAKLREETRKEKELKVKKMGKRDFVL